jgi:anti-sigma-K factor RskA
MSEQANPKRKDDELAIEFAAGLCEEPQRQELARRAAQDGEFARRVDKARSLFGVLDHYTAPAPSELVIQRTLAAVSSAARTRMLLDREAARAGTTRFPTFSLKELGALAALLFIGVALLLPSFQNARQQAQQVACQAQTGQIGVGLAKYAADNRGQLPAVQVERAGWLRNSAAPVTISNSRNLWTLIQGNYAPLHLFQCPALGSSLSAQGVQIAGLGDFPSGRYIDYSFQHAVNSRPLNLDGEGLPDGAAGQMVVLSDRTPVFVDGRFDPARLAAEQSPNHDGRGQAMLFLDLHTGWSSSANVGVNQDNIWLLQGVNSYQGTEQPVQATDSFLLPSFIENK